ncbi:MAG: hypothetical protein GXX83_11130 [Gaiellales bacterium]|nr:hypothetical protein [Gaiellales bacterium]
MPTARGESPLTAILSRLKAVDISSLVALAGRVMPHMLDRWLQGLDARQRRALEGVLPVDGRKKLYLHVADSPTPPIVIRMARPVELGTVTMRELERLRPQGTKGLRMTTDDLQLLAGDRSPGGLLRLLWRLRGQASSLLSIAWTLAPLLRLGPSGLKGMGRSLTARWKPLLDLLTEPR